MGIQRNDCRKTREKDHQEDDSDMHKTRATSSDEECGSIASSNTEICGEIDYQDLKINEEESEESVREGDGNSLPISDCDESFNVNQWLGRTPEVQSVVRKQVVESIDNKKYLIRDSSNGSYKARAASVGEIISRPISMVQEELCKDEMKETLSEKSISYGATVNPMLKISEYIEHNIIQQQDTQTRHALVAVSQNAPVNGLDVKFLLAGKLLLAEDGQQPIMPSDSNTELLNTLTEPDINTDQCKAQEPPSKESRSCNNGVSDREEQRVVQRNTDDQEIYKRDVSSFQLKGLEVKLYRCNDKARQQITPELVLSSNNCTAIAGEKLSDNTDHYGTNRRLPLKRENNGVMEKPFVTTQSSTTLLSSEDPELNGEVPNHEVNASAAISSSSHEAESLLSSDLQTGSTLLDYQGVFRTKDEVRPFKCGHCDKTFDDEQAALSHVALQHQEKRYSCEFCGKRYSHECHLGSHMRVHMQKQIACDQCGRRFSFEDSLRRHSLTHTKDRPFSCSICHNSFKSKSNLSEHCKIHRKDDCREFVICSICKKEFSDQYILKEHMKTHYGEKPFKCRTCDRDFRLELHLQLHTITHHKNEKLVPEDGHNSEESTINEPVELGIGSDEAELNRSNSRAEERTTQEPILPSTNLIALLEHLPDNRDHFQSGIHSVELESIQDLSEPSLPMTKFFLATTNSHSLLSCRINGLMNAQSKSSGDLCNKVLSKSKARGDGESSSVRSPVGSMVSMQPPAGATRLYYENAFYTKGKEMSFSCGYCGKAYKVKHSLYRHITIKHRELRYSCEVCGKRYAQRSDVAKHAASHSLEKPFTCDQCGMQFRLRSALRKHHQYKHSEERPFLCNKCDKTFKTTSELSRHRVTHESYESREGVICSICNRKLGMACQLKEHMMIHTGEKPFKCPECDKQFRMKFTLNVHMKTHRGLKTWTKKQCTVCGKSVCDMPTHMRMHSGEKPFECSICLKKFPKKTNLEGHMRSHTGEKPFACSGCDKRFALYSNMMAHKAKCIQLSDNLA